ncbi:MAG: hypothetical protein KJO82_10165 [Gammaproteobacteria bacterium]|nr:hypothetical protein [Gammaproteobacteria bacterium]NNC76708.1 hypothetical protein [Woeseiaceae bacterium]
MSTDKQKPEWPAIAGDPDRLASEIKPPDRLEDELVGQLLNKGLIRAERSHHQRRSHWTAVRASLAAAASVALVAIGVWIGYEIQPSAGAGSLTGAESNLYAFLLYETERYDPASGAEAMTRYGEYSAWVAKARERGQFVTGEDLEVHRGWTLSPSDDGVRIVEGSTPAEAAALSGIFFIKADSPPEALELARELPHIRHGGNVLVQKTIRTDVTPDKLN